MSEVTKTSIELVNDYVDELATLSSTVTGMAICLYDDTAECGPTPRVIRSVLAGGAHLEKMSMDVPDIRSLAIAEVTK